MQACQATWFWQSEHLEVKYIFFAVSQVKNMCCLDESSKSLLWTTISHALQLLLFFFHNKPVSYSVAVKFFSLLLDRIYMKRTEQQQFVIWNVKLAGGLDWGYFGANIPCLFACFYIP